MNSLISSASPYLLQHAHNPVNWFAWDEAALQKAKAENKPILLSIGYATCHWCHVMAHESFEDQATANVMNQHFINIKVDREERPDIDHLYMDALQAMTGSGGWPLNIFLTPDLQPFYGGTYFPPKPISNKQSFTDVLLAVASAWKNRNTEIISQATELVAHIKKANSFGNANLNQIDFNVNDLKTAANNLLQQADLEFGGFGAAPKFPQLHSLTYLIRHHHFFNDSNALNHVVLSLTKMIEGGIYDQLAGGIARYSTDIKWTVPHFEKMLYDNALFIQALAETYQVTKNKLFKIAACETIDFLLQHFKGKNNLFYCAIDADSEGIEGKYYCWSQTELETVLEKEEFEILQTHYDITEEGNFYEPHYHFKGNILTVKNNTEKVASLLDLSQEVVEEKLQSAKQKLLQIRSARIPPITDTKSILSWNALLLKAFVFAYEAFENETYLNEANHLYDAIVKHFYVVENRKIKTVKHLDTKVEKDNYAFLDDIAYLADALIVLQNFNYSTQIQNDLSSLIEIANNNFKDSETDFYFFSAEHQKDILIRKKEIYDGATPSANAILANVIFQHGTQKNQPLLQETAIKMLKNLLNPITKHTNSFAIWACLYQKIIFGIYEITIPNQTTVSFVIQNYIPYKILNISDLATKSHLFMLCKNQTCFAPVNNFSDILMKIADENKLVSLT
jgi:uncharacterized protein